MTRRTFRLGRPRRTAITLLAVLLSVTTACGLAEDSRDGAGPDGGGASDDANSEVPTTGPTTSAPPTTAATTSGPPTSARPPQVSLPGPYIAGANWAASDYGPTLKIEPTENGRHTEGADDLDTAWAEVLAIAPGADTPGMEAQFACHWLFARPVEPDKPTWNLEPWRPIVSEIEMVATGCNPGAPEV